MVIFHLPQYDMLAEVHALLGVLGLDVNEKTTVTDFRSDKPTATGAKSIVSVARTPSVFQVDGFWKAQGMRSSMRDTGWPLAMAVSVARR